KTASVIVGAAALGTVIYLGQRPSQAATAEPSRPVAMGEVAKDNSNQHLQQTGLATVNPAIVAPASESASAAKPPVTIFVMTVNRTVAKRCAVIKTDSGYKATWRAWTNPPPDRSHPRATEIATPVVVTVDQIDDILRRIAASAEFQKRYK